MLSLVAYQSSDDSASDTEETSNNETQGELNKSGSVKSNNSTLSSAVHAKTKEAVKITVPSLKEFEDDEKDEPPNKKIKKPSGSGLISMLPPPKYSKPATSQKSFMPYVLTKKQVPSSSPAGSSVHNANSEEVSEKPSSSSKPLVRTKTHFKKELAVVEDDDHTPVTDFFSLQEPKCSFPTPVSNKLESPEGSSQVTGQFHQNKSQIKPSSSISSENNSTTSWSDYPNSTQVPYVESASSAQNYVGPYPENESLVSNSYAGYPEANPDATEHAADEGFLKLQGKKRKGQAEEIKFIDVSVDDQLSDKTQWLTKSITEELVHRPSRRKNDMPTQLQKRKHQITYLAFQAKERELELKNQWSQNRLTKRETQAKYGF